MKKLKLVTNYTEYDGIDVLPPIAKDLMLAAMDVRKDAYAPYSRFLVGAALLLENGEIVKGSNQENASYPSGLCAERVAIYYAGAKYPNVAIKMLAITVASKNHVVDRPAAPCGACRQSIAEYETKQNDNIEIFFMGEKGKVIHTTSLKALLPFGFDGSYL
ncbi:MAG: cytidine deaminase [Flavobacteriaceae bacterium]|nr:cytidine deaminase [Flavobacteriaceae bacterium]